jgi:hypothetical protein
MRSRLRAGRKRPWGGLWDLEGSHEWMFKKWYRHRAEGKETRREQASLQTGGQRTGPFTASHDGTRAECHANGTQGGPNN